MSSSEKVLKEMVSSSRSSSAEVGMAMPPKSVRCVQSQWR